MAQDTTESPPERQTARTVGLGGLSSPSAHLCLDVERFLTEELGLAPGMRWLLAVSGGADSTALAVVATVLAPRLRLDLHAVHIDHGLRPESGEDARHAATCCENLGIPCIVLQADVAGLAGREGIGIEAAGRELRYDILGRERERLGADFMVLGHHAGDLTEDVFLRLLRGAGWPALGGMPARDAGRNLLRPLLFQSPERLRTFLEDIRVPWREDGSNADPAFTRNRVRHRILPLCREENPALDRAMGTLHRLAELDGEYFEGVLSDLLAAHPWTEGPGSIRLSWESLRAVHPALRLRLYMAALNRLGGEGQARGRTLLGLDRAVDARRHGCHQLPGETCAWVDRDGVTFRLGEKDAGGLASGV
ncbi:MAG: tRNA lysidine(34) synthetase TilS [Desulfovibrio sp.]|jgi:tRNA(Ile)-lysidine synthase|nr:tRNA lysidine(34) synthetase TilS [Desulfovibrio sp.]